MTCHSRRRPRRPRRHGATSQPVDRCGERVSGVDDGVDRVLAGVGERLLRAAPRPRDHAGRAGRQHRHLDQHAVPARGGQAPGDPGAAAAHRAGARRDAGRADRHPVGRGPAGADRAAALQRRDRLAAHPQPGPAQRVQDDLPANRSEPQPTSHEGFEWLYVLSGRLRLVLGEQDFTMASGEAAEFDTRHAALAGQHRRGPGRGAGAVRSPGRAGARASPQPLAAVDATPGAVGRL